MIRDKNVIDYDAIIIRKKCVDDFDHLSFFLFQSKEDKCKYRE
jgi:hypothetical protein